MTQRPRRSGAPQQALLGGSGRSSELPTARPTHALRTRASARTLSTPRAMHVDPRSVDRDLAPAGCGLRMRRGGGLVRRRLLECAHHTRLSRRRGLLWRLRVRPAIDVRRVVTRVRCAGASPATVPLCPGGGSASTVGRSLDVRVEGLRFCRCSEQRAGQAERNADSNRSHELHCGPPMMGDSRSQSMRTAIESGDTRQPGPEAPTERETLR